MLPRSDYSPIFSPPRQTDTSGSACIYHQQSHAWQASGRIGTDEKVIAITMCSAIHHSL